MWDSIWRNGQSLIRVIVLESFAKRVCFGVLLKFFRSGSFLRLVEGTGRLRAKTLEPWTSAPIAGLLFHLPWLLVLRNKSRLRRLLPATSPRGLLCEGDSCRGMAARKLPVVSAMSAGAHMLNIEATIVQTFFRAPRITGATAPWQREGPAKPGKYSRTAQKLKFTAFQALRKLRDPHTCASHPNIHLH